MVRKLDVNTRCQHKNLEKHRRYWQRRDTLFHAFISPRLSYGIINLGNASKSATNNLSKSLKKAIRIMNFGGYRAESKPSFSKLGLLKFKDTYKFETAKFMHDVNNNNSLPLVTTECRKKIITFNGIKIWNEIPFE